jgi:2-hydroxychromene-2-carboxylate isomerase
MHPRKSSVRLIVYFDIKSPYGLVAYRPTLALEAELGIAFDWRPLTLNIPSYLGSAEKRGGQVVASRGRSERTWRAIRYSYHDARRYAERQGLMLKGTEKIWNSRMANIAILWVSALARPQVPDFLHAIYPPFWRRELDIEDIAVIKACLESAGISAAGFEEFVDGPGGTQHDKLQSQFHSNGIYGVPTYVLDGEALHGREHIPFIRWYLSGQHGSAPDIAYELGKC